MSVVDLPERYVHVYPLGDGRWTWRLVEQDAGIENGPAYPLRRHAAAAVASLFPDDPIVIEDE